MIVENLIHIINILGEGVHPCEKSGFVGIDKDVGYYSIHWTTGSETHNLGKEYIDICINMEDKSIHNIYYSAVTLWRAKESDWEKYLQKAWTSISTVLLPTFIQDCIAERTEERFIDDYIDYWHESSLKMSLIDFLGFTKYEYQVWLKGYDVLPWIISKHRGCEAAIDTYKIVLCWHDEGKHSLHRTYALDVNNFNLLRASLWLLGNVFNTKIKRVILHEGEIYNKFKDLSHSIDFKIESHGEWYYKLWQQK
jgi:hypothetical protein